MSARPTEFAEERQGVAAYVQALRDHWLLVVGLVLVAVLAAAAYSFTATKRYDAEADLLVTPISSSDDTYVGIPSLLRETDQGRAVLTAARLIKSPEIADRVRSQLGLDWTRTRLLDAVSVTPVGQSNIVTVGASSSDAAQAAELANAFAQQLIEQRTALFQQQLSTVIRQLRAELGAIPAAQQQLGQGLAIASRLGALTPLRGQPDPTLQLASRAVPPATQSWPRPALSIAVALVASLVLGIGLAIALELISPRITSEDDLLLTQRLPILARVPRMAKGSIRAYLRGEEPLPGNVREAYRTLRAALGSSGGAYPSTVLVTSAVPGEGKTMTSVHLATTLAAAGVRTIIVDADLRRPMVGTVLGVSAIRGGLASVLLDQTPLDDALVPAPGMRDELRVLPASSEHAHLVDLFQPGRMEDLLAELRLRADVVVIDSAPLTEVADALMLASDVEAIVVAVRLGRTRRDKLNELRRMLARRGVSPAGFIVTTRRRAKNNGYYYGADKAGRGQAERAAAPAAVSAPAGDDDDQI